MDADGTPAPDACCGKHRSALLGFMRDARLRRMLVWTPIAVLGLYAAGLTLIRCPLVGMTGCRCPGCGMTRSVGALGRGDLEASFAFHPFGALFFVGWLLLVASELLGGRRERLIRAVAGVEGRWPISSVVLGAFAVFGMGRLLVDAWGVVAIQ